MLVSPSKGTFHQADEMPILLAGRGGGTLLPGRVLNYRDERNEWMARLRFATALTDLITAFGADDRGARRRRMGQRLAAHPELAAALGAVHAGPWTVPAEAFSPDKLTALALS